MMAGLAGFISGMVILASSWTGLGSGFGLGMSILGRSSCTLGGVGGGGILGSTGGLTLIGGGGVLGMINSVISYLCSCSTCFAVMPTIKTIARIIPLTMALVMKEADRPSGSGNKPKFIRPGEYVVDMIQTLISSSKNGRELFKMCGSKPGKGAFLTVSRFFPHYPKIGPRRKGFESVAAACHRGNCGPVIERIGLVRRNLLNSCPNLCPRHPGYPAKGVRSRVSRRRDSNRRLHAAYQAKPLAVRPATHQLLHPAIPTPAGLIARC